MTGSPRSTLRQEGALTIACALLLAVLLSLVYIGKPENTPPQPVYANSATAKQMEAALGLDRDQAEAVIRERDHIRGFADTEQILRLPLFTTDEANALAGRAEAARLDLALAPPASLRAALGLSAMQAQRLAAGRPAHTSLSVSRWLRGVPLLDAAAVRPVLGRVLIRAPGTIWRQFVLSASVLVAAIVLLPGLLRRRIGGDAWLLPLSLLLSGLGVCLLFSVKDPLRDQAVYLHHVLGVAAGVVVFFLAARLAPTARRRLANYQYLWVLGSLLLVTLLLLFGHGPEDVRLNLIGFQPVEIVKICLVLFTACYLADRGDLLADRSAPAAGTRERRSAVTALPRATDLLPLLAMFVVALGLFYVVKDLGPGVLLFGTFTAMLYLATGRLGFVVAGLVLLILGGSLGYLLHVGVYPTRVDMWRSPFHNSHPTGMQLGQSIWAMASGGVEGSGPGRGMGYLIPRSGSDMAFASWVEDTGLAGAFIVLSAFAVLTWRGMRIALRASSPFDRMLASGVTALIGLQALFIIGGVTGLLPLSGIALPFLSFGNSALLANFLCLGLLRGISAEAKETARENVRPEVRAAATSFALAVGAALLLWIGAWRVGAITTVHADALAAALLTTPDADGASRPHRNPRLLAVAASIERGSIYDRKGRVVATSRAVEIQKALQDEAHTQRMVLQRRRYYPYGAAMAHPVGYQNTSAGGPYGIERKYDAQLSGYNHLTDLLYDYRNRGLPFYRERKASDIHLALDAEVQKTAFGLLSRAAARVHDTRNGLPVDRGALVVVDPGTGDVLAAVSIPSFDPNSLDAAQYRAYTLGTDAEAEHRFINRALNGLYPPGSTLKVATAACAIEELPNWRDITFPCNRVSDDIHWRAGGKSYVRRNVRDDKGDPAFGRLSLAPAFRVSSNIYFANLAAEIGAPALRAFLAVRAHMAHTPAQPAFDADLPDIGYGQGRMLAAPVEMARLAGCVANGGQMMDARVVTSVSVAGAAAGKRAAALSSGVRVMRQITAQTVAGLMRDVVARGTAKGVFDPAQQVAGKTGTAQNHQFDRQPHSWFIGFAPSSRGGDGSGTVAFACVVENGGYGKTVSAVICRDLLKAMR